MKDSRRGCVCGFSAVDLAKMQTMARGSKWKQGLDLRYLRQGYLEEDYILDLGRVETTLLDLSYWMLFLRIKTRWQKMKKTSRFFEANFFEAILASKRPPRPNMTLP